MPPVSLAIVKKYSSNLSILKKYYFFRRYNYHELRSNVQLEAGNPLRSATTLTTVHVVYVVQCDDA